MEYISIRVNTLRGDQKIDFDVYVLIHEKYIHYLKKGDSFEGQRLDRLKTKKLKKMYIKTESEELYRSYIEKNIDMAYNNPHKDLQLRSEIIQGDQQSKAEEVFENPRNPVSYAAAKDAASKYVEFLMQNEKAAENILSIQNTDSSISHHGVSVATLAMTLSQHLHLFDQKQKQLMTLGALLHDFGHFNSSVEFNKSKSQMTKEELKIYNNHHSAGAQAVQSLNHFDQTVINIINQHEELIDGSGPIGLLEKDQDPISVVVSTANALDREILQSPNNKNEVIKNFIINNVGRHPLSHLQALKEFLLQTK